MSSVTQNGNHRTREQSSISKDQFTRFVSAAMSIRWILKIFLVLAGSLTLAASNKLSNEVYDEEGRQAV